MKDKRYEEVLDDYNIAEPGLIEEIFPHLDPEIGLDRESTVRIKGVDDKGGNLDQDLRLVNAYFKEVSSEQLLTPEQEIDISSNIKGFENKANRIKRFIEKEIGIRIYGENGNSFIEEVGELLTKRYGSLKNADREKQTLRLLKLYELYIKEAKEYRNRFIKANLRLVASVAKRYVGRGTPFLDLLQEGNIGLIRAAEKFDHTLGYRFSTYAIWWINQSILRAAFSQTRTVRIPTYVLEKSNKVREIRNLLEGNMGRKPLNVEIAKTAKMSEESVNWVLGSNDKIISLDTTLWGDKTSFLDIVADTNSLPADSLICAASVPDNLEKALLMLSPREREIIKMRFGIGYDNISTLDEVGKRFGLTRERIRQIEKNALEKIKNSNSGRALKSLIDGFH